MAGLWRRAWSPPLPGDVHGHLLTRKVTKQLSVCQSRQGTRVPRGVKRCRHTPGCGSARSARRQAEDQLPRVVGGAVHALQPQATVYARMRLPEELPVMHTRSYVRYIVNQLKKAKQPIPALDADP